MSTNPHSYTATETLYRDERTTLYRALRGDDGRAVVLKVLDPRRCLERDVERLRSEYETGVSLCLQTIVRPLGLETYQGMPALILEDFGGQPLDRLLGAPMPLERFLDLAIRIARAVADVHRQGLVHKDLKPANLLVHPATNEVRIADFGLASRLPSEQQPDEPPRLIEGSLPYMSPEQTGRMNRALDSRTDLYTLGVTFYQMLTGRLPFDARDPLEWVHCHVARAPASPSQLVPEVPETVARIVTKLLAKMAEDRYQTAGGLRHDLERCLRQWRRQGSVDLFRLGAHDTPSRFQIPQKLYGREESLSALRRAFERVVASGTPELVRVPGYSGIGKSSLVQELKPLACERGVFLSGKFDPLARGIPYAPVVRAFADLIVELLAKNGERASGLRDEIQGAVGALGKLLADVIASLKLLIGEQPPVPELPAAEGEQRFRRVFRAFLGVFAKAEHPLVVFLDDLQWADDGSLRLVEDLITNPDTRHLLVIGAYRDNELAPSHPLVGMLERIRKTPALVDEVVLSPLGVEHVVEMVADALHADREHVRPLASLVHEKTGGNPFFVTQFMMTLCREHLLALDEATLLWRWDIERIRQKGYTDNVVDLMARGLTGLRAAAQDALKLAACIGHTGQLALLAWVNGKTEEATLADLWDAMREGFIVRAHGTYRFAHDRFRQAAYSLVPEDRRGEVHLKIGRLLLEHTPQEQLEERLFDVVAQLDLGAAQIPTREERTRVAELNLRAARRAKTAAAYPAAVAYLLTAEELFGGDRWSQHERAFALHLDLAECQFLSGGLEAAERCLSELMQEARSRAEKAAVYRVQLDVQCVKGEGARAIETALQCLGMLGIDMAAHPSDEEVRGAYEAVWKNLGSRRIEELIDLPPMTDPEMQAAMEILSRLYVPTYYSDNNLFCLHLCHAVNLSLRHGNSPSSTYAYGWFGVILVSVFHRAQDGYRFAKLGYDLMERGQFLAYKAKANMHMKIVAYWTRSLDEVLKYARACFEAGLETGDVVSACFSRSETVLAMLARGDPLSGVQREAERGLDFARRAGFADICELLVGMERFVRAMRGGTRHLATYDDERFSEAEFESRLAWDRMPSLVFFYLVMKLMARFLSGDHPAALAAARQCRSLLWAGLFSVQSHWFRIYHALTLLAVLHELSAEERQQARTLLEGDREQLRESAAVNPRMFHGAYALVSAEVARVEGRELEAERHYEEAIQCARENGFVQDEGLARELASKFYRARGFGAIADTNLRDARACYLRWGASGKVKQIDELHPHLLQTGPLAPTATLSVRVEQLDLLSAVKASQTISGLIEIEQLVGTLLQVALEEGGARQGYLVLVREGNLFIEAEARLERVGVVSRLLPSLNVETSPLLPASVIHCARLTREPVILVDATANAGKFASDAYFAHNRPRSVLCLPIVRHDLAGLLYLENDLVAGAFTPDRLTALSLLAAQAAISMENALHLAREHAARAAAEFLSEAGALLSESLDCEKALAQLGRLCVKSLADWCAIDRVDGGEVRRLTDACRDTSHEPALARLRERHPVRWASPHPAARCLREAKPVWLPEVSDDLLRSLCEDDEHLALARQLGTRSVLAVPFLARGATLGALSLSSAKPGRYGRAELALGQEVAHRAAMAIDNARLYDEAQEGVRVREEFLSVASHELRTPTAGIMLSTEALAALTKKEQLVDPRAARLLDLLLRQGRRLNRLVGDLLDLSRIQTDRLSLELADCELGVLVREVVERLAPELARAGCPVSIQAGTPVTGRWDRSRLDQVVTNLLSNAMKFGKGEPVEISAGADEGCARLAVRDRGIGISPELQPRIFSRFERGVSADHYGGLGLGLYISRRIVEAHGGSIRVESRPGAGATFTVELPRAGPQGVAAQA